MQEVSLSSVLYEIQKLGYNATDPRMDGYYNWGQKQKLYEILWETERQLKKCSSFSIEEEWLNERKQDKMLNTLQGR